MSDCEDGMDPSDTPDVGEEPGADEALSPFDGAPLSGRRVVHIALLVVLVVPAVFWLITQSSSPGDAGIAGGVEVDGAAPDFALNLFDGEGFSLSEHLRRDRRPVVMNFWASWCVPCRQEMPALDAVARRHPEVLVLGVAVQDTDAAAREFAEEIAVSFPLGLDDDGVLVELYPTLGLPTTWFITSEGTIAARWTGELDEARLVALIEEYLTS